MGRSIINKLSSSPLAHRLDKKWPAKNLTITRCSRLRTIAVQGELSIRDTRVSAESFMELDHIIKDKQDLSKWLVHRMLSINISWIEREGKSIFHRWNSIDRGTEVELSTVSQNEAKEKKKWNLDVMGRVALECSGPEGNDMYWHLPCVIHPNKGHLSHLSLTSISTYQFLPSLFHTGD